MTRFVEVARVEDVPPGTATVVQVGDADLALDSLAGQPATVKRAVETCLRLLDTAHDPEAEVTTHATDEMPFGAVREQRSGTLWPRVWSLSGALGGFDEAPDRVEIFAASVVEPTR